MQMISNPILPGFNPDPSIVRVGEDYYIATSTFEWFPGLQIHHSKDLIHWRLIARPLNRPSQLEMRGNPSSGGVWAPCLSYDNGIFYLAYSDVKNHAGIFKDVHNYLITASDIQGDWSDPVYLNSSGFDPSLFHDDDGRKWLVNVLWDFRKGRHRFGGISLQEYSPEQKQLIGEIKNIFQGTSLRVTEGPHLYKQYGCYFLLTAEGGTDLAHAVTVARSKSIDGPYEVDPRNPILTSKQDPTLPIQKAGHADLVETQNGEWYLVHLGARMLPSRGCTVMGRETCIQKVYWTADKWIRLEGGGNVPHLLVPAPKLKVQPWPMEPVRDDFESTSLNMCFQSLRVPLGEDSLSLTERPGFLRLKGRESLSSKHHQTLVARRQQSFSYSASTCIEFEPESYQQMAGLICLHDTSNFYYLRISHDESAGGKCLGILTCQNGSFSYPLDQEVCLAGWERCHLKVIVVYDQLRFYYSADGVDWTSMGPAFDASTLSDEFSNESSFTGAFIGLCCQDLSGRRRHADFDYFEYQDHDPMPEGA